MNKNLQNTSIRVFLSSTFRDFQGERQILQDRVVPAIRETYASRGVAFELVDLRWGIPPAAARAHRTIDLCKREIERCGALSPHCHFLFMLGNRYGWRPAPHVIAAEDYERLSSQPEAREVLQTWYQRDANAVPPVWRLRPPAADGGGWETIEAELVARLEAAALAAGVPNPTRFGASVTETEIRDAFACRAGHPTSILGVLRDIPDLGAATPDFLDIEPTGGIDREAARRLEQLKAEVEERLPKDAVLRLQPTQADVAGSAGYFDAFAAAVEEQLRRAIECQMAVRETARTDEATLHEQFRRKQRQAVRDRTSIIAKIVDQANLHKSSPLAGPLIVAGPSGAGKTAVMAAAWEGIRHAMPDAVVIYRAVGGTVGSATPSWLLADINGEIARFNGLSPPSSAVDDEDAAAAFLDTLQRWSGRPLVIMVDALDQLRKSAPDHQYNWVPATLPPGVVMVLSTVLDQMPAHFTKRGGAIFEIPPMPMDEAGEVLDRWFAKAGRTLQPKQRSEALRAFSEVGLPLYLRLLFELAREWRSDDEVPPLPTTLAGIIDALFDRLSDAGRTHIPELSHRVFGFLAASREGLGYDEMQDALSCEADLKASAALHWPDARRQPDDGLPQILWSRLYHDLQPLLTERIVDGIVVLNIFHRAIETRLAERVDAAEHRGFASALADYFSSRLSMEGDGDPSGRPGANRRSLGEIPHLLERAGRIRDLKAYLLDYRFLQAKVLAGGIYDLIQDFQRLPSDTETATVCEVLRLAAHVLESDPAQFSGQLLGRIDRESTVGRRLLRSMPSARRIELLPGRPIFSSFGGHLVNIIRVGSERYSRPLFPVTGGETIATTDDDGAIGVWNVVSGKRILKIAPPDGRVWRPCAVTPDGRRLAMVNNATRTQIHIVDLERGEICEEIFGEGPVALSGDGKWLFHGSALDYVCCHDLTSHQTVLRMGPASATIRGLAASQDGRWIISWPRDFDSNEGPLLWDRVSGGAVGTLRGDFYARADEGIYPTAPTREKHLALFTGHNMDVRSVAFTRDGRRIISSGEEGAIVIWDRDTREQIKKLISPKGDMIGAYPLADGTTVASVENGGALRIWDIETGQRVFEVTGDFSDVTSFVLTGDGRLAVTGRRDGRLYVWRLERGQQVEAGGHDEGQFFPTIDGSMAIRRYVASNRAILPETKLAFIDLEKATTLFEVGTADSSGDTEHAATTPDRRYLVRTSKRGIYVFDLVEKTQVRQHSVQRGRDASAPILSPDGLFALCEKGERGFTIVEALTGTVLRELEQERERSISRPDSRLNLVDREARHLIQLREGQPAEIYDTVERRMVRLDVGTGPSPKALVLPDGKRILSTGDTHCLVLWTTEGPAVLARLGSPDSPVSAIAVSNDGNRAVTVHRDKSLRLWDLAATELLARLDIDRNVDTCAFINDDRAIALCGNSPPTRIDIQEAGH